MQAQNMTLARISTAFVVVVAMMVAPLVVAPAQAGPMDDARKHYQRGSQLYQGGDYEGAIREFRAADKLAPAPLLLYNIALSYDRLGRVDEAIEHYRKYLDAAPGASNRAEVEKSLKRLSAPRPADPYGGAATDAGNAKPPTPMGAAPAPSIGTEGTTASAGSVKQATPYSGTDSGLRRVDAINIAEVESRYRSGAEQAAQPHPGAAGTQPNAAGLAGPPPPPPEGVRGPAQGLTPRKHTPVYKKWWFWVVVGVGAIVLINVVANSGDDTPSTRAGLFVDPSSTTPATAQAPALWRF